MKRISKEEYYLNIAEVVASRGTCLRRNYGAIIVKKDRIVATGYTGAPRGVTNCCDIGTCKRNELNIPSGERYELCRSLHAEINAIASARPEDLKGSTLYLVGKEVKTGLDVENTKPCTMCQRLIEQVGISNVIVRDQKNFYSGLSWEEYDNVNF